MKIKSVSAKTIFDSRKAKTIEVTIITTAGKFSASAPSGKSTGKHEVKTYKKSLEEDIKALKEFKEYFSQEVFETFDDLRRVEDIVEGHVGGNTMLALEYATLKALAASQKKEVWQIINPEATSFPRLVGNCVGGGAHTSAKHKKPDFQEFLIIPKTTSVEEAVRIEKKIQEEVGRALQDTDSEFKEHKNDENAWITSLNEKAILDILKTHDADLGLDVAASEFYKRKKYHYDNPMLRRTEEEQLVYLDNLVKNYSLLYIEDPFHQEDFDSFAALHKKRPQTLVVGDDLTVTSVKRLKKAIEKQAINALIVKPNQCGSLMEVKRVVELSRKNNITLVFSHRSGETVESILADLAFGFQADFLKIGISGPEREAKTKRLIEIEKSLKK